MSSVRRPPTVVENRISMQKESEKIVLKIKTVSKPELYSVYRVLLVDESSSEIVSHLYEDDVTAYFHKEMFVVEIGITPSRTNFDTIEVILSRGRHEAYIYEFDDLYGY
jgi:hypothetical protein